MVSPTQASTRSLYTCLGVQELLLVFKDDPENKFLIKMFVKSLNIFTCFIRITISIPIFLKQFSSHLPTKCHMMGRSLLSFSFSNILAWAVRGPGWGEQYFYTYWWVFSSFSLTAFSSVHYCASVWK
jgi:hypothetical protein